MAPEASRSRKILVAIPHYHKKDPGSTRRVTPEFRARCLAHCLTALHSTLGSENAAIDIATRTIRPANQRAAWQVDVRICTTGDDNVIDRLAGTRGWFEEVRTDAEPTLLGYECHAVLRDNLDAYGYFAYLEDDLVVHDPQFIDKCAWFASVAGDDAILQPNRFEIEPWQRPLKFYIDGDIDASATRGFQDVRDRPVVKVAALGRPVLCRRAANPHAGCFFLSRVQMAEWASRPYFLDRATSFIGPLESAATLGVMRTFRVYKPAATDASFLEIQNVGKLGFRRTLREWRRVDRASLEAGRKVLPVRSET